MSKKIPVRRCVGCQEMKGKKEMIRVIRTPEGDFLLDATGKKNGRGAYLCPSRECLDKARKNKGLERSFKQAIPKEVYEALEKEMQKCFADAKRQVEQYVRASAGGFQIENLRERCEKRVGTLKTKLRTAVAFIKEQANEVDALKAELKKLKSEDGEVTMERLRQELREVKADAEVKAIALERVNAHNQALAPMADRLIHIKNGQVSRMELNENPTSIDEIEW